MHSVPDELRGQLVHEVSILVRVADKDRHASIPRVPAARSDLELSDQVWASRPGLAVEHIVASIKHS
jgi:hypothetical protein